jgi:hypothetical protein
MEVLRLLYFNMASILDAGKVPNYQASMEKTYLADLSQELASTGMDILGMAGQVKSHDERAVLEGMTDYLLRWTVIETIYGGSSEIQRSIMAQRGLGLPRA